MYRFTECSVHTITSHIHWLDFEGHEESNYRGDRLLYYSARIGKFHLMQTNCNCEDIVT